MSLKRFVFPFCLLLLLAGAPSAAAADGPFPDGGAEAEPSGWSDGSWGDSTRVLSRPSTGAHNGTYSLKVAVSGYENGDAKWVPDFVDVTGGAYYTFSDWYKSDADSAVAMYWETAQGTGTWATLETGIEPSADWKQFRSGVDMPDDAVRAKFVHFIAENGFLQTDDYALDRPASPQGFDRPLVSLTFDDSTANQYEYVLPELDKVGFKSTQYVVTGATGTPSQWTAEQIKDVHRRGHEIGSHTEFHPHLAKPGRPEVCKRANGTFAAASSGGSCPAGQQKETRAGSWLDPFGGPNLWMRPATPEFLADTTLTQELGGSKTKLEAHIGHSVPNIAYPFGGYDSTVVAQAKADGYKSGRAVDEGYNSKVGFNPFKIKVQNIQQAVCTNTAGAPYKAGGSEDAPTCNPGDTMSPDVTTAQFKKWIQKAKANNYWLVLVYHPVDDLGLNPYGTSEKRFGEQMQAIKDAGIEVKTMRDALNEVMPQLGETWEPLPSPGEQIPPTTPPPGPIPGPDPTPVSDHPVVPPPPVVTAPAQPAARDTVRPRIRITSPTRRIYRRGRKVRANFTCLDDVRVVKCKGTVRKGGRVNTRTRGRKAFKVVAVDSAGNTRSRTISYRVR